MKLIVLDFAKGITYIYHIKDYKNYNTPEG